MVRRRPRTAARAAVLATLPAAGWAALRVARADRGFPVTPAVSFTPYAAAGSLLPLAAAVRARSLPATLLATAPAALLVGTVLSRLPARRHPVPAAARPLRLVSLNMLHGRADAEAVVALAAAERADVLTLMEVTPEAVDRLVAAGVADLLPEAHVVPAGPGQAPGAGGALWTRLPVLGRSVVPGRFGQPAARLAVAGAPDVEVTAVHTHPPVHSPRQVRRWEEDLTLLPAPADGVLRVLAGDFNATWDHAAFGRLLRRGWVDAARATGQAWRATWQPVHAPQPRLTLDHVLVDPRIGVRALRVVRVPGSDHRALVAELLVPLDGPVDVPQG